MLPCKGLQQGLQPQSCPSGGRRARRGGPVCSITKERALKGATPAVDAQAGRLRVLSAISACVAADVSHAAPTEALALFPALILVAAGRRRAL